MPKTKRNHPIRNPDRDMLGAVAAYKRINPKYPVVLRGFNAVGLRWSRCSDGSYQAKENGRFIFTLRVRRFEYPYYTQDSWTLKVEGIGWLEGLNELYQPNGRYFGSLPNAFDLVADYRAAALDARRMGLSASQAIAHILAAIDTVFARGRAAAQAIRELQDENIAKAKAERASGGAANGDETGEDGKDGCGDER